MAMDATKVLNGSFGEVHMDGVWMTNITSIEANVEIGMEEVQRSGTRWIGQKLTTLSGSGSIGGYRVSSVLVELVGRIMNDANAGYVCEIIASIKDPEAHNGETYRVRIKGVQFTSIPAMQFEVGALVEEEWEYVFSGFEILDRIAGPDAV
jgi:hypothetical protein